MHSEHTRNTTNLILLHLSENDFGLLTPDLEAIDLPFKMSLEAGGKTIEHVYFIESGFASVVAKDHDDRGLEVGLIGREGVTGMAVILGADRSPNDTYIQLAGSGQRITSLKLRDAIAQSVGLHRVLLAYGHSFLVQTASTALSNGRGTLEARLARWLLMAQDRAGGELALTQEFLAIMLGVRRPGVTVAINLLEQQGLIHTHRGVIRIVDREGLMESANGTYGVAEGEFHRLLV